MTLKAYLQKKGAEYAPFDQKRFKDFYITHLSKEANFPRVVQIVGTNGKGSTGRFLAEILRVAVLKSDTLHHRTSFLIQRDFG